MEIIGLPGDLFAGGGIAIAVTVLPAGGGEVFRVAAVTQVFEVKAVPQVFRVAEDTQTFKIERP